MRDPSRDRDAVAAATAREAGPLDRACGELLELIFGGVRAPSPEPRVSDHAECVVLSASLRGKLCDQFPELPSRRLASGERLYLVGSPARTVYSVRSGLIRTSAVSPDGQEVILGVFRPGDVLGELCLCGGGRREQATALEPSEVVELPVSELVGRLRRD